MRMKKILAVLNFSNIKKNKNFPGFLSICCTQLKFVTITRKYLQMRIFKIIEEIDVIHHTHN